jgi:uncharacterized protein
MKTTGLYGALLLTLILALGRPALAVETIGWDGLVPPMDESLDPYTRLSEEQQNSLYDLWMMREMKANGSKGESLDEAEQEATAVLEAAGYDTATILRELDEYLKAAEENNSQLVVGLDGKDVKIPGYALPTEFVGDRVVEFLLVPYYGACVHTPAPPANQMVHVRLEEGFTSEGLFMPVWVTGQISTAMTTQAVSLSDGELDVEAGYQIKATDVAPYE